MNSPAMASNTNPQLMQLAMALRNKDGKTGAVQLAVGPSQNLQNLLQPKNLLL